MARFRNLGSCNLVFGNLGSCNFSSCNLSFCDFRDLEESSSAGLFV